MSRRFRDPRGPLRRGRDLARPRPVTLTPAAGPCSRSGRTPRPRPPGALRQPSPTCGGSPEAGSGAPVRADHRRRRGCWRLIGGGALYVSFSAQYAYVFAARHQNAASIIEALLLDLLMIVFTLLALGLSRAGKSSRTERALILACAAASAYMNVSAADTASRRAASSPTPSRRSRSPWWSTGSSP